MFRLLLALILLLNLISCGKETPLVSLALLEQKSEESQSLDFNEELRELYFMCSSRAQYTQCLGWEPIARVLPNRAFYSHYCYEKYVNCLNTGRW